MKQQTISVEVFVLEESDLDGLTDEARATGELEGLRKALESKVRETVGNRVDVTVGFRNGRGGTAEPWVNIAGVKLLAGQAVAFLPTGPARVDVPKPAPVKKAAKKAAAKSED